MNTIYGSKNNFKPGNFQDHSDKKWGVGITLNKIFFQPQIFYNIYDHENHNIEKTLSIKLTYEI